MRIHVALSFDENDPLIGIIRKYSIGGEKNSKVIYRMINRYIEILHSTPAANNNAVADMINIVLDNNMNILGRTNYPAKEELISIIRKSAVEERKRILLENYLNKISVIEYIKLIEAIEFGCRFNGRK